MTLENRVEILEKELKRTKRHNRYLIGAVLLSVSIGILGAAPSKPGKEIRANKFIVEDENGKTRAVLDAAKDGTTLNFRDENGNITFSLDSLKDASSLILHGKDKSSIMMGVFVNKPLMILFDEKGNSTWSAP